MENPETIDNSILHIKSVTWHKDSHSLFDYQFNKNVTQETFDFDLGSKFLFMYRNNKTNQIMIKQKEKPFPKIVDNFQFLGGLEVREEDQHFKLHFMHASLFKEGEKGFKNCVLTEQSQGDKSSDDNNQDIYLIVRSLKNKNHENKGYKLQFGQKVRLGRIEYKVSAIKTKNKLESQQIQLKSISDKCCYNNDTVIEAKQLKQDNQCKYCLEGQMQGRQNFFISPCKCSGSTGVVHFSCLEQWIRSKIKKQINGGTLHYNFEKFNCQLCKQQFPRYIKKNKQLYELMYIQKPDGTHMVLESISQKSKSLMVIQNIPEEGLRIGRSHECQIRVQDISISRNHAYIQKIQDEFYIFDNKSKFGTLVCQQNISFELNRIKQGVQIGRTVFTFQLSKL